MQQRAAGSKIFPAPRQIQVTQDAINRINWTLVEVLCGKQPAAMLRHLSTPTWASQSMQERMWAIEAGDIMLIGAAVMSVSTVIVAVNAQQLHRSHLG